jgi:hypothetical protein
MSFVMIDPAGSKTLKQNSALVAFPISKTLSETAAERDFTKIENLTSFVHRPRLARG